MTFFFQKLGMRCQLKAKIDVYCQSCTIFCGKEIKQKTHSIGSYNKKNWRLDSSGLQVEDMHQYLFASGGGIRS